METPPKPQTAKPASSKAWIWILIIVVLVLLIGGVAAAFLLTKDDKKVVPVNTLTNNSVSNAITNEPTNAPVSEDLSELSEAEQEAVAEYVTGILPVLDDLTAALQKWEDAADMGSSGDFDGSTAALEEGLEKIADGKAKLAALEVTSHVERLHELMQDALDKTEEALDLGIEGNEGDDIDKIEESGSAIDEVAAILEEATTELDNLSAQLGI
jgi:hypothetical protein